MKKSILSMAFAVTMLFMNSFGQVVTDKGGASTPSTKGGTSTSAPASKDASQQESPKDKVKDEMSKDAATTAREWTQKMDEVCDLTADQERKIMEINLRYANRLEELKAKYQGMENPNHEAAKREKDELTKQRLGEYAKVLNKEQMRKFKEYREKLKGNDESTSADKKDKAKDKYENATPEEKEKMKEEMKEKKEKKSGT